MAFVIAVYASRSGSPLTMQDSLLAVSHTLPDGTGYPQGHNERFPIAFRPPFPSFAWRDITMSYIVEQTVKGHIYLYSVDSYWGKEKKQPRQRRTYIGKKDPATGALIPDDGIRDAREFGNIFLLQTIARRVGVWEDLAAVFPDTWRELLSIAFYRISEFR